MASKKNYLLLALFIATTICYSYNNENKNDEILLSFVVPCYNRERTLAKTIASIYKQTVSFKYEVICVDDGSTDTTYSVLQALSKQYPNLRIYTHNKNLGASEARNTAIKYAQGSLIFTLDSDNILLKNTIQPLVNLLLESKCDAASFSGIQYIDEDDQPIRSINYQHTNNYFDARHILRGTPSPASSGNYLYTKESFYRAGGYQGEGFETWEFGFRQIITKTKFALLPNSYYKHRISNDSYYIKLEEQGLNDKHCAETLLKYSSILTQESLKSIQVYKTTSKGFFTNMRQGLFKTRPLEEIEPLFENYAEQLQIKPPSKTNNNFLDIAAMGYEQYQDIIINNNVVLEATGQRRDCAGRYKIIQRVLDRYKRPFTMIDLGASQGYYSFRTAYDYPATCVMIDDNNWYYTHTGDQLLSLCEANNLDNVIFLKKELNIEDITQLGTCEHFDVILAMNIIHWFGDQWKDMANAIFDLGNTIIIETPPEERQISEAGNQRRKEITDYILAQGGIPIGKVKRHTSDSFSTLYCIEKNKNTLKYASWIDKRKERNFTIKSSFQDKHIFKPFSNRTISWVPGINLITFKMYNGAYPRKEDLLLMMDQIIDPEHDDWMPNNMILQGKKLVLIDKNPPEGYYPFCSQSKQLITEWLSLDKPDELYHHFWNILEPQLFVQ